MVFIYKKPVFFTRSRVQHDRATSSLTSPVAPCITLEAKVVFYLSFPRLVTTVTRFYRATNSESYAYRTVEVRTQAKTVVFKNKSVDDTMRRRVTPEGYSNVQLSPIVSLSHEIGKSKVKTTFTPLRSCRIANFSSPSDDHVLESAVRDAMQSAGYRLTIIVHSSAFANQDTKELFRNSETLDLDTYREHPRRPTEDEGPVKKAGAVYAFESGAPQLLSKRPPHRPNAPGCRLGHVLVVDSKVLVYTPKPTHWNASHIPLQTHANTVKPSLLIVVLGGTFDHLHARRQSLLSAAAWIARKEVIGVTGRRTM